MFLLFLLLVIVLMVKPSGFFGKKQGSSGAGSGVVGGGGAKRVIKRRLLYFGVGIAIVLLLVLPQFLSGYWILVLTQMLIFGLFAASLDLIGGYTGFISLGPAMFFGTGAYALAISLVRFGTSQVEAFFIAIAVIVALAMFTGAIAVRARGVYFLMITLGLAQCVWAIAWKWASITGGNEGMGGIVRPDLGLSWWSLSQPSGFYYFVLAFFILAIPVLYVIIKSPFGQTLVGIRESEVRMRSLGYNVWLHANLSWIISALYAGLAGILFAWLFRYVSPDVLTLGVSAEGWVMVILGGLGTLWGALTGAIIVVFLKAVLSMATEHWLLIIGAIYVVAMIYIPHGVMSMLRKR